MKTHLGSSSLLFSLIVSLASGQDCSSALVTIRADINEIRSNLVTVRSTLTSWDPIQSCNCNLMGSASDICDPSSNRCQCYDRFIGRTCDQCAHGRYSFPDCFDCGCNLNGTIGGSICNKETGQCLCRDGFSGARCDVCGDNLVGNNCDRCQDNYFAYPSCTACNCHAGSLSQQCDSVTGQCTCSSRHTSLKCDQCTNGFFGYPDCQGTFISGRIGPQLFIMEGYYVADEYSNDLAERRQLYVSRVDHSGPTETSEYLLRRDGIESIYFNGANQGSQKFGAFGFNLVVPLDGSFVLCADSNGLLNCQTMAAEGTSSSRYRIGSKILPMPLTSEGEESFLVGGYNGIYRVRSDYHVDFLQSISQSWTNRASASSSFVEEYGNLHCSTRLNSTTIVGVSGIRGSSDIYDLYVVFYDVSTNQWAGGPSIQGPDDVIEIFNCQMSDDHTLLFEQFNGFNDHGFHSIDINTGISWDDDWYGLRKDFDTSFGTLIRYGDGLIYVGGLSSKNSRAILYKHQDSFEWVELDQELNEERIRPTAC